MITKRMSPMPCGLKWYQRKICCRLMPPGRMVVRDTMVAAMAAKVHLKDDQVATVKMPRDQHVARMAGTLKSHSAQVVKTTSWWRCRGAK